MDIATNKAPHGETRRGCSRGLPRSIGQGCAQSHGDEDDDSIELAFFDQLASPPHNPEGHESLYSDDSEAEDMLDYRLSGEEEVEELHHLSPCLNIMNQADQRGEDAHLSTASATANAAAANTRSEQPTYQTASSSTAAIAMLAAQKAGQGTVKAVGSMVIEGSTERID